MIFGRQRGHAGERLQGVSPVDFCLLEIKQIVFNAFRSTIDATTGCQLADCRGG
jgi:hypothetical protein